MSKNQSFSNNSGKLQPIRTKFGIHAQVKGCKGRSGNFQCDQPNGEKWGLGCVPHSWVFTARCICISAVYAVTRCPSVCASVTFVSCTKMNKDIFEILSPSGSDTILVFPVPKGVLIFRRNPPNRGRRIEGRIRFLTNISLYLRNSYS